MAPVYANYSELHVRAIQDIEFDIPTHERHPACRSIAKSGMFDALVHKCH